MPKKRKEPTIEAAPSYGSFNSYALTDEQIAQIMPVFHWQLLEDSETDNTASVLVMLLRAFTYTTDVIERERMLLAAEGALMPFIGATAKAMDGLAIRAHQSLLRVGGEQ